MRPLLIVSDSHGLVDELLSLIYKYPNHTVLHLGDYCINEKILNDNNIIYVRGNCDFSRAQLERLELIDDKKIFMTHGHKYDVKYNDMRIYYKALEAQCDYCLFGHTHIPYKELKDNIWFINPGSFKSGTYAVIENDNIQIKNWK